MVCMMRKRLVNVTAGTSATEAALHRHSNLNADYQRQNGAVQLFQKRLPDATVH